MTSLPSLPSLPIIVIIAHHCHQCLSVQINAEGRTMSFASLFFEGFPYQVQKKTSTLQNCVSLPYKQLYILGLESQVACPLSIAHHVYVLYYGISSNITKLFHSFQDNQTVISVLLLLSHSCIQKGTRFTENKTRLHPMLCCKLTGDIMLWTTINCLQTLLKMILIK